MRLIDADVLETRLANLPGMWASWNHWKRVRVIIEDMTKVDPVKHGHWIERQDRIGDEHWLCYDCSECGNMETVKNNYCPMCGARMDDEVTE